MRPPIAPGPMARAERPPRLSESRTWLNAEKVARKKKSETEMERSGMRRPRGELYCVGAKRFVNWVGSRKKIADWKTARWSAKLVLAIGNRKYRKSAIENTSWGRIELSAAPICVHLEKHSHGGRAARARSRVRASPPGGGRKCPPHTCLTHTCPALHARH